jgi:membrane fusion protein (multidrug efflux system)
MNTPAETAAPTAGGNGNRSRVLRIVTAGFLVLALLALAWWKLVLSVRETTTDAYVAGNTMTVSAAISGTVVAVNAEDTQAVRAGDVLVQLDAADAQTGLDSARGTLAAAVRSARVQSATAAEADAAVSSRQAELANARATLARREPLAADAAVSHEELEDARDAVTRAEAALRQAQSHALAAHAAVDGADVRGNPAVIQALAGFRQAWLNVHRATVVAPASGRVAQRTAQVGRRVQAGAPLMLVIPEDDLWIEANFKETQLRRMKAGLPARVVVDLYGGKVVYHGHVAGVSPGTGAAFALLPPQNASGNWIKVIQRVPVRIVLDPKELAEHPLHIGLSVEVNVDLAAQPVDLPPPAPDRTDVYAFDAQREQADAEAVIAANLHGAR